MSETVPKTLPTNVWTVIHTATSDTNYVGLENTGEEDVIIRIRKSGDAAPDNEDKNIHGSLTIYAHRRAYRNPIILSTPWRDFTLDTGDTIYARPIPESLVEGKLTVFA